MIPCADGFRISSIITRLCIQGGLVIKGLYCRKTKSSWNDSSTGKHIRDIVLRRCMFRQYILEPISLMIFCSQLKYCGNCCIACKDKIATNVATHFVQNSCCGMRKIYCGPIARNYDKTSCMKVEIFGWRAFWISQKHCAKLMKDATGVWFEDHGNKLLFPISQKRRYCGLCNMVLT